MNSEWQHYLIPGKIKLSTRHRFIPGSATKEPMLIEDIVLQEAKQALPKRK